MSENKQLRQRVEFLSHQLDVALEERCRQERVIERLETLLEKAAEKNHYLQATLSVERGAEAARARRRTQNAIVSASYRNGSG